ncbi:MAG: hypothetical protein AABW99_00065 [archaeon]
MAPLTLFLGVLILALLIGNGLLFLFRPKEEESQQPAQTGNEPLVYATQQERPSIAPLEKKIELAHKRIQELEKLVADSKGADNLKLRKKVEKLDHFRSTAEAEIIAMKDILKELQDKNVTVRARSFRNSKREKNLSPKKLHAMIFNSSK